MADIAIALRAKLFTYGTITSLIGQRIYADRLSQRATLPAVEMTVISDVSQSMISDRAGIQTARVQFICVAANRSTAREVAKAIRTSGIGSFKGVYSAVDIRGVEIGDAFDDSYPPLDGSDNHLYSTMQDLVATYLE